MNYTNFTTEQAGCQQSMFKWEGRDIAYVVFSILQILITFGGLYWANRIIKNKEWKDARERLEREERDKLQRLEREDRDKLERLEREERDKLERLEREERDKIAQIVSSEYYEIESICGKLRKCKRTFEAVIIFCGRSCTITGLDVLKYMCHPNNYPSYMKNSKKLEGLHSDLNAVVRLFQSFRIKLPLKGTCPENIREELGPLVIELGDIAGSFVSGKKYYTISKVLKYFEDTRQCRSLEEQHKLDFKNNENVSTNIPYINDLCFGESSKYGGGLETTDYCNAKITLKYHLNYPEQGLLAYKLELNEILSDKRDIISIERLRSYVDKINNIVETLSLECLESLPSNIRHDRDKLCIYVLHAIRVFSFMVSQPDGRHIINDQQFEQLVDEITKEITKVQDWEMRERICLGKISFIQTSLDGIAKNLPRSRIQESNISERLEQVLNLVSEI